jgi:ABC-2 type transport system ATP-binding protein
MSLLKVSKLNKIFPGRKRFPFFSASTAPYHAVKNLDLELREGELLGLLGPNGAGKTTTIEMLLGTLLPTSGEISYFGKDFLKHRHEILQSVTHASAYHKLPSNLTVLQCLNLFGRLYSLSLNEIQKRLETMGPQFGASTLYEKQVQDLSAGQMTRVMLLKAFLPKPKIVLLDEPTASLDPDIAEDLRSYIKEQQRTEGISIVLTSHNMEEVAELCDRVLVLKNGQIIEEDTPERLARSVAQCDLKLENPTKLEILIPLIQEKKYPFDASEHSIDIQIDEGEIAALLQELAKREISYEKIAIHPPTLEDFFIHIARQK